MGEFLLRYTATVIYFSINLLCSFFRGVVDALYDVCDVLSGNFLG